MRKSEFVGVLGVSYGEKSDDDLRQLVGLEIGFFFKDGLC